MPLFDVTLHDPQLTRGWVDLEQDDGEPAKFTNESVLQVDAKNADAAMEFAETHNPGLTASDAKAVK